MRAGILLIITGVAALAVFCGPRTQFIRTGVYPPPYHGDVRVFFLEPPEDLRYLEVGLISAARKGDATPDLIRALQKQAARNGANAIIIRRPRIDLSTVIVHDTQGLPVSTPFTEVVATAIRIVPRQVSPLHP